MKVLVTAELDPEGAALLTAAGLEVTQHLGDAPMPPDALLEAARGASAVIAMPTDRISGAVMDAGPLRVVANHAVGYDNVDLAAAQDRGVVVTNTPGVLTDATADFAMALLLAAARHIVSGDRMTRSGGFKGWRPTLLRGLELSGATLGIVGKGQIGSAVAHRAQAFGMQVVHHNRTSGVPLQVLLEMSDVVSLHCPLTAETHHLIDAEALAVMKPTAILVNPARGPVVDEAALATALREGGIAAAALDVFEDEPRVHPDLFGLPNVLLAPHAGSATFTARRKMAVCVAENVIAVLSGRAPSTPVS